ncbi:MAG: formylglycine-generating enzyme family protein [Lentisphaerae bacterium]|nr:formylglycine-generating enzyme family protein [Lentisphaerota bacterium]
MQNKKHWLRCCLAFGWLFSWSAWAAPEITNIVCVQREGTKLVDITYDLADLASAYLTVSIRISKDAGATWDVPCTSVSGNGIGAEVTPGTGKSIVWNAGIDWNRQWSDQVQVEITATTSLTQMKPYLVINLLAGPDATTYPVTTLDAVPGSGWTDEYKTTKLVLRRVPAGTFTMGSPTGELGRQADRESQHQVTLTKDFYVGVFEVTQKQWERVKANWPSWFSRPAYRDARPVEEVSYTDIRGNDLGRGWPANNAVDANSFMGLLRAKTGLIFDLPTEAQWEYACRAGTETALNSGKNLTNENNCSHMAEVGRYLYNNSDSNFNNSADTTKGTNKVGSYMANQWGLYDMHGNVLEWCLDRWFSSDYSTEPVIDPKGDDTGDQYARRGGYFENGAAQCRAARREHRGYWDTSYMTGFRLVLVP